MFTAEGRNQPRFGAASSKSGSRSRQRLSMLAALAVLLITLVVLLAGTDRQYWISSIQSVWSQVTGESASNAAAEQPAPAVAAPSARPKQRKQVASIPDTPRKSSSPGQRLALAPLEVEVIAHGNQGQAVRTRNASINLDLQHDSLVPQAEASPNPANINAANVMTDASEHVRLSPETAELVTNPVGPSYPLLAKQMKVQGSVVLQARIGKDGDIQDLQVMKGPEILSNAAVEAVKQWRFKPHLQAGQAVETDARITVYFTIATR